ncbi:hypothetical protein IC762_30110 [Bradyrhizobium genosp. L]|uniref:hypothetical protein n=1 Tax=Bradyrhizobium genosp. L TaxID=83637 RepID=UPI0018A28E03|nr:hypothetical protein [Bradyrhizobium genosp. L]QPF83877.1 hypothetical protein IC762_30110 [Bradyrhizobium genosp. L]
MRSVLLAAPLALMAGAAVAQDWGNMATISSTLGNNTNRLCIGDHSRPGDIGCPTWAPSLTTAGDVSVSGNLSAAKLIGDGSGLTNVGAAGTDRITSGTTSMLAISGTGYISLTRAGTNAGWFDPSRGLVTIGVSSAGTISGTNLFASGNIFVNDATYAGNGFYVNNARGVFAGMAPITKFLGMQAISIYPLSPPAPKPCALSAAVTSASAPAPPLTN